MVRDLSLRNVAGQCRRPTADPRATSRWASLVVRATDADFDPRTLALWGRCVGASVTTLRSRCRLAGVRTKASLDFARLLRAVTRSRATGSEVAIELDVYDLRTLRRLMCLGGLAVRTFSSDRSDFVHVFLRRQQLVQSEQALHCIARELSARGLLGE